MTNPERYSLLAGAVAGRKVGIVREEAERSYTDGDVIYAAAADAAELERAGLVVQASLLAAGSLDAKTVTRLTGRRNLRHRYLTLEAIRAMNLLSGAVPRPVAERIADVYDGPVSASRKESLERVVKGREDIPEAPPWFGTIKPGNVLRNLRTEGAGAPTEKERRQAPVEERFRELDDEEESDSSRILELFTAPAMRNPLAEVIQRFLGMGRSPQADGGGGEEMPVGGARVGKVGDKARAAVAPADLVLDLSGPPVGRRYPEWDWQRRRYKEEHCAVAEWDPRLTEDDEPLDPGEDRRLRRELARLGLALERRRRQPEGDVLDVSSLIDYVVDKRVGGVPDPRVYETRQKTGHDLGVVVLLDATGSTGESDEGRRVFDEQCRLAARLTSALDQLGDRVACHGFQSCGRETVRFLRVKDFDDRYDHAAQRRLAALEPGGFTRLGAAIRHATWMLSERAGTGSTLLVVVGDGLPYDDGYEHRYAQEDSRRALREAVVEGVGCACLSVRSSTEDEVIERVWGAVPHRRLEDPSELAHHVIPLFRAALTEAAASRRRTERRER